MGTLIEQRDPRRSLSFRTLAGMFVLASSVALFCGRKKLGGSDAGTLWATTILAGMIAGGARAEDFHDAFVFLLVFSVMWADSRSVRLVVMTVQASILLWWRTHDYKCPFFAEDDAVRRSVCKSSEWLLWLAFVGNFYLVDGAEDSRAIGMRHKVLSAILGYLIYKVGVDVSRLYPT